MLVPGSRMISYNYDFIDRKPDWLTGLCIIFIAPYSYLIYIHSYHFQTINVESVLALMDSDFNVQSKSNI